MSHIEPHPHPAAGVYAPTKSVHEATIDKTGAGTYVSSENDHAVSPVMGNEVLEHNAQTKGRWFQYVKTKQFWITLLLGQGELILYLQFSIPKLDVYAVLGLVANEVQQSSPFASRRRIPCPRYFPPRARRSPRSSLSSITSCLI
jgi:hypothetical protein